MKRLLAIFFLFISNPSMAANYKGIEYTLEPIYGQQKVKLTKPYEHAVWKYFYGVRISGGYKFFNLEGMYTKTEIDQIFSTNNEVTRDIIEKLSLGCSTSQIFNNWSLGVLRIGAQAKRIEHHSIISGVTTITTENDEYHPYLGVGLEIYFKEYMAISLGVTVIFNNIPDSYSDNDYEYSSGFKLLY